MGPAMERKAKIEKVSSLVYQYCVAPDLERVKATGSILPTTSLRHRATRHALRFAKDLGEGRFFTEALTRDVLRHLVTRHNVHLPSTPGFQFEAWVREQGSTLHKLLKRARKSVALVGTDQHESGDEEGEECPAMDEQETQAWSCMDAWDEHGLDPAEDSFCNGCKDLVALLNSLGLHRTPRCSSARQAA